MSDFIEKIFKSVSINEDGDRLIFTHVDGTEWVMEHLQDCCESVTIEDVCGDLEDLVNTPILEAWENTNDGGEKDYGTFTWTFYNFKTIKGTVTLRWSGESNGYYSESVNVYKQGTRK